MTEQQIQELYVLFENAKKKYAEKDGVPTAEAVEAAMAFSTKAAPLFDAIFDQLMRLRAEVTEWESLPLSIYGKMCELRDEVNDLKKELDEANKIV